MKLRMIIDKKTRFVIMEGMKIRKVFGVYQMRGTTLTTKRIAMPKLRAVKFQDRRTKRKRTRSQQSQQWRKENDC